MPIVCPLKIDVPPPKPLHEIVLEHFHEYGDDVALEEDGYSEKPVKMTYRDIRRLSIILANNLHKLGFCKNDIIAVYLENRIHFATLLLAVSALGGAVSGVNPMYTAHELQRQLKDSGSKFIFTKKALLNKVHNACESLPNQVQRTILVDGTEDTTSQGLVSLNDLYIGTTGLPKGVMLTHANLNALFFGQLSKGFFRAKRRVTVSIIFLPFFHVVGFNSLVHALHNGNRTVLMTKYESNRYVELIAKHKATTISCVPSTLVYLTKDKQAAKYDLSSVNTVGFGAAPAGKELIEGVMKRFPNLSLVRQGYGMTETAGIATTSPDIHPAKYLMGSCGIPIPTMEIKVIDDNNNELSPMQKGEICLRGSTIMKGYINNEKATRETIDTDGWLHTGDLGYYDHFGHVYIVDRLKELIKYKGFQVAPAEIEDLILQHPSVQEVGVVGLLDPIEPDIGEMTTAFVVLKPGFKADSKTEQGIIQLVAENAAHYKQLRGGVKFCRGLPKGPSGKILRREIRNGKIKLVNENIASKL